MIADQVGLPEYYLAPAASTAQRSHTPAATTHLHLHSSDSTLANI